MKPIHIPHTTPTPSNQNRRFVSPFKAKSKPKVKKIPAQMNTEGCENQIVKELTIPRTTIEVSLTFVSRHFKQNNNNTNVANTSVEYCFNSEE